MNNKSFRVRVDQNRCASSGNCAEIAPVVFTQDDNTGVVILREEYPTEQLRDTVKRAAMLCPAQAIHVEED